MGTNMERRFKNGDPVRWCITTIPEPIYCYGRVVGIADQTFPIWIVLIDHVRSQLKDWPWDCATIPDSLLLEP